MSYALCQYADRKRRHVPRYLIYIFLSLVINKIPEEDRIDTALHLLLSEVTLHMAAYASPHLGQGVPFHPLISFKKVILTSNMIQFLGAIVSDIPRRRMMLVIIPCAQHKSSSLVVKLYTIKERQWLGPAVYLTRCSDECYISKFYGFLDHELQCPLGSVSGTDWCLEGRGV